MLYNLQFFPWESKAGFLASCLLVSCLLVYLKIKVNTELEADWTWIWIYIHTICNLRIESLILGDDKWILHCEVNTAREIILSCILEECRECVSKCDVRTLQEGSIAAKLR